MRKWLGAFFAVLLAAHVCLSAYYAGRWFFGFVLKSYLVNYNLPVQQRLFTMSPTEYRCILALLADTPEDGHIYWSRQPDPIVNYYIFPRRMFITRQYKPEERIDIDPAFLRSRGIKYFFVDFDNILPVIYDTPGSAGVQNAREGGS